MDFENAKKRIKKIYENLSKWSEEYYTNDKPTVDDSTYDDTLRELNILEKLFPKLKIESSPTNTVGAKTLVSFKKANHVKPMLSLKNAFNNDDLFLFNKQLTKDIEIEYFVEPKVDGLSISITYCEGKFVRAVTRGDGFTGEDVTQNVIQLIGIPKKIKLKQRIEIRGEIYIPLDKFSTINMERSINGEKIFVNPRNAAAGTIRQLDKDVVAKRGLESIIYWAYDIDNDNYLWSTQERTITELRNLGFNTSGVSKKAKNIKEVISAIEKIKTEKDDLNYEIDGIVIKVNNTEIYENIGVTSKFPKWAIAFKLPSIIKETKLIRIFPTVGRTGRVTYNAELSEVNISGTTVRRSTLHNSDYIKELDIREGDIVRIKKAGEIIPKIISVNLTKRPEKTKIWKEEHVCPSCNKKLHRYEGEVDQYCININCVARLIESINHFISRNAMNIEGFSIKQVEKFISLGWIKNISDIYRIKDKRDKLLKIGGYQEKSINSLLSSIETTKTHPLYRLIFGLGIRYIGLKTSKDLANHFLTLDNIIGISIDDLLEQDDFGDVKSTSIINYFNDEVNIKILKELKELGIDPKDSKNVINKENKFFGKKIVITGSIKGGTRGEINSFFEKKGARVMSSISKETDYLIAGKKPSENKLNKIDKSKIINVINIHYLDN